MILKLKQFFYLCLFYALSMPHILCVYFRLYPTPCGPINSVNAETSSTVTQQQGSDIGHLRYSIVQAKTLNQ